MSLLILGLLLFLGVHSVRIVAEDWRSATRERIGERTWKGAYSLLSLLGFVLICYGYGQARGQGVQLWVPPVWTRHLAGLLTWVAFVLLAASGGAANAIKARLHHPMVLGVKVWAAAHLLANGTLASTVLFGSFLVWAVLDFRSSRQRDRREQKAYPAGQLLSTALAVVSGTVVWAVFAFWAHGLLIGVRPFG